MRKIPPPEKMGPYWHALGKFVQRYAEVEFVLNNVLRVAAKISIERARAVFSGTRVEASVSFIKRLHEADGKDLSPWLEKAFSRIGEITKIRDHILHHGVNAQTGPDVFQVTSADRTLASRAHDAEYSVADLDNLEADLNTIYCCLAMYWIEDRHPGMKATTRVQFETGAHSAWRYRPARPEKNRANARDASPMQ